MQDLQTLIDNLQAFAQKRLNFERPPKLFLKQDEENAQNVLGKTAFYDPQEESVTLFISNRHPKDILRSLAHELVHHTQNLRGDLSPEKCGEMGMGYAQTNPHMREMEREAYEKGNMCFRDWEDNYKTQIKINTDNVTINLKENKKMVKISRKDLKGLITKLLSERTIKEADKKDAMQKLDADKLTKELAAAKKKGEDAAVIAQLKKALDKQQAEQDKTTKSYTKGKAGGTATAPIREESSIYTDAYVTDIADQQKIDKVLRKVAGSDRLSPPLHQWEQDILSTDKPGKRWKQYAKAQATQYNFADKLDKILAKPTSIVTRTGGRVAPGYKPEDQQAVQGLGTVATGPAPAAPAGLNDDIAILNNKEKTQGKILKKGLAGRKIRSVAQLNKVLGVGGAEYTQDTLDAIIAKQEDWKKKGFYTGEIDGLWGGGMRRGAIAAAGKADEKWTPPGQSEPEQFVSPSTTVGVNQSIADAPIRTGTETRKMSIADLRRELEDEELARQKGMRESRTQTPESEKALNESMFGKKNNEIFNRLKALWAK